MRQHFATFAVEVESLPHFVRDEFDVYLKCGILAHGFLRLRCNTCMRELLVAFSCKLRGICPSSSTLARRISYVIMMRAYKMTK